MREGQKRDAARKLRRNATDAEQMMWFLLRDRRLGSIKFRRQVPIGPYVADFASIQHRLVVELDGGQHADSPGDARRDAFLAGEGWRVLRFWNNDALINRDGVLEAILLALTPALSRKRERV
jgi:very-short-patch-repair endonuclease